MPGQNKLFINKLIHILKGNMNKTQEITQFMQNLVFFFISGDTMKISVSENSSPLSLTHVDDFGKYSRDVDLSPPERSG